MCKRFISNTHSINGQGAKIAHYPVFVCPIQKQSLSLLSFSHHYNTDRMKFHADNVAYWSQNQIRFGILDLLTEIESEGAKPTLPDALSENIAASRSDQWVLGLRQDLSEITFLILLTKRNRIAKTEQLNNTRSPLLAPCSKNARTQLCRIVLPLKISLLGQTTRCSAPPFCLDAKSTKINKKLEQ